VSAAVFAVLLAALASALGRGGPVVLPTTPPAGRAQLVADLDLAQTIIDDRASPAAEVARAGQFEQLATRTLARDGPTAQRATLAGLAAPAASTMRTNLQAAAVLAGLVTPRKSLPRWRIAQPPPPGTLLGYFRAAAARFGVPWEYLAAIEFLETKFGRVQGLSTAGAEGPMQFLPATWARYGRGDVRDPRDAVLGAARYLVANGAPRDMPDALYHYNPSSDYVRAITDYATRMRADPRAYDGYYWWQVIYARCDRSLILPVGYPAVRPVPVP
jgi:membrane-bound lytic murein transglycosylase B